ncbi:MAG: 3-hydroxyacyl-CoA dehydrogenase family protein [Proteobacteria bacterium]|nr:3-hydroxyacyl-CoA dehydrogenase family protein [Pseudomonadota bacterium]
MIEIRHVAIIGTGLMGCGIAQVFASHPDHCVTTFDSHTPASSVQQRIRENLERLVRKKVMAPKDLSAILSRISTAETMEAAAKTADLVIECIPEDMVLKQNLFCDLEKVCKPEAVFASNTSVMSITEIASKTRRRHRIVGTHFWNPPYLIPLVEVIKSDDTDERVMAATMAVLKKTGKHPVRVNKDVPGFLANRLQHALWREAISIVAHGIADAATVDEAIRMGFGLRLPVLGPMENADMVGNDLVLSIHNYILPHLENSPLPSPLLQERVDKGELGFKTGKGFQDWSPEQIEQSRKRLTEYLIDTLSAPKGA